MTKIARGSLDGSDLTVAVVQARFNEAITERLLDGALAALRARRVAGPRIHVSTVPGAVEIPLVAQRYAASGDVDAVLALGAVIRGETSHYDQVCAMAADGCARVALDTGVPVVFGVLTCDTAEQAFARAGENSANKGHEAAEVAVEMANLLRGLEA